MKMDDISAALTQLEQEGRLRVPDDSLKRAQMLERFGGDFIDAASNDYLGLALGDASPAPAFATVSRETASGGVAPGAGSSRLVFGSSPVHLGVEQDVATWLGLPAGLLFSSGYAANVGALGALLSEGDAVFSDSLNHASLIDGMRLARVRPQVFPHLDLGDLEKRLAAAADAPARWVVVESYYSMDGDGPDLRRLRTLCDQYDASLYVDEAHSVGTFGPAGAGLCTESGVRPDVLVAAFGKAVGSAGACVLGSAELRTWLWNRARSFVFSTAPSPLQVASLRAQIARTRAAHGARDRLRAHSQEVRAQLLARGVPLILGSFGPVTSLILGGEAEALSLATRLQDAGILAQAVRPPTVPVGQSRVRLILRATHTSSQLERLVEVVARETSGDRIDA